MLSKIKLKLSGDVDKKHGYFMGSILHGAMMDMIDKDYVDYLHESRIHPYSQYIQASGEDIIWSISTTDDEAKQNIIDVIKHKECIALKHRDEKLLIQGYKEEELEYSELINTYYMGNHSRYLSINFITPASFKIAGIYRIYPEIRYIFQSLMNRFDAVSEDMQVSDREVLEHFETYATISAYRLRSTVFHLQSVKIPSFMGEISIKINGPHQMVNLAHTLVKFGEYSGIGIKTAMGMGGMVKIGG